MSAKFRTNLTRVRVFANPGSNMVNDYISVYDEDGKRTLEVKGQYDIQQKIESYRANCDLKTILERYKQTGDISLLDRKKGFYADVVGMPETYADVVRLVNAGKEIFDSMSAEDKVMFNNNFEEFIASFDKVKGKDPEVKEVKSTTTESEVSVNE